MSVPCSSSLCSPSRILRRRGVLFSFVPARSPREDRWMVRRVAPRGRARLRRRSRARSLGRAKECRGMDLYDAVGGMGRRDE
ncbi:toxin-antitoxin system, toxin component, RelE domain protein [Porphyromonas sp. oral taxon 278 str. W7784]|nr:toxin-antitoxin system, toxin component, RelE domain protein [Porphyromonas sp. oral taxon 278 str. W7784]